MMERTPPLRNTWRVYLTRYLYIHLLFLCIVRRYGGLLEKAIWSGG